MNPRSVAAVVDGAISRRQRQESAPTYPAMRDGYKSVHGRGAHSTAECHCHSRTRNGWYFEYIWRENKRQMTLARRKAEAPTPEPANVVTGHQGPAQPRTSGVTSSFVTIPRWIRKPNEPGPRATRHSRQNV